MKTVKALVAFSNGVISMEQYEVRELPTDTANDLIAAGICVEISGGSGGGVLVVTDTNGTLDKTWQEINAAVKSGLVYVGEQRGDEVVNTGIIYSARKEYNKQGEIIGYGVSALYRSSATPSFRDWTTETADGYPTLSE